MSGKTKIVVLHKKELMYTIVFVVIGIIAAICILWMTKKPAGTNLTNNNSSASVTPVTTEGDAKETISTGSAIYQSGIYHSVVDIGENTLELEVIVDNNCIKSVALNQLSDSVSAMYPLVEPALEDLEYLLIESQDVATLTYSDDSRYTSMMLLRSLESALEKAETK